MNARQVLALACASEVQSGAPPSVGLTSGGWAHWHFDVPTFDLTAGDCDTSTVVSGSDCAHSIVGFCDWIQEFDLECLSAELLELCHEQDFSVVAQLPSIPDAVLAVFLATETLDQ